VRPALVDSELLHGSLCFYVFWTLFFPNLVSIAACVEDRSLQLNAEQTIIICRVNLAQLRDFGIPQNFVSLITLVFNNLLSLFPSPSSPVDVTLNTNQINKRGAVCVCVCVCVCLSRMYSNVAT